MTVNESKFTMLKAGVKLLTFDALLYVVLCAVVPATLKIATRRLGS